MNTAFNPFVGSSVAFSAGLWILDDWLRVDSAESYITSQLSDFLDGAALRSLYGMNVYEALLTGLEYGLRRRGYNIAAETLWRYQGSVSKQPDVLVH
jgi:hypothetical protein